MLRKLSRNGSGGIEILVVACLFIISAAGASAGGMTFEQLAALRSVDDVVISGDGTTIAYALTVPRTPDVDDDGPSWVELHVIGSDGRDRVFVGGEVKVSEIGFSPDGSSITYLARRNGDDHKALWAIPVDGGESRRLVSFETEITGYRFSPDGTTVAFVAAEPTGDDRGEAKEKGYSQEIFEEDWLPKRVWLHVVSTVPTGEKNSPFAGAAADERPRPLSIEGSVFHVRWSPDGKVLAVDIAPTPLIDDRYMARRIHIVDAVDALVEAGVADRERVGITGGSYGGYATAWCATRYSERFRAGVMFVGISNDVSKGLTTEIPVEDKMVHTLADPWTKLQFRLERSPISYVAQSRTPLLIAGGTADSRVHPSQSLQLYRALKLSGKAPVRYVRYPGEKHGNSRAASRDDYARRLMRWMDHFVMEGKTSLPPMDVDAGCVGEKAEKDR